MKILVLTNRLPYPLNDGGNIATYYNLQFLTQRKHQITLFSLNTNKHHQNPKHLQNVVQHIEAIDINTDLSKRAALKALFLKLPYNAQRFYSAHCEQKLQELLQKHTFDIIQLEGPYMFLYYPILRQYSTAKIVYRAHNIEYKIWERQAQNEKNIARKIYLKNLTQKIKKFEIECLKQADSLIAISLDDALQLQKLAPNKKPIHTIPAGIDLSQYTPPLNAPQTNTLCFIGSLQWLPNLQGLEWFLNNVWQNIAPKHPHLQFHVAGKNPPQKLAEIQLPGYVFHGMVAKQQDFINQYDILIVPLLSGSGIRIKILEALALKKCIISTSIGCEGIALTHKKNIWIANTPQEIAHAIVFLTQNPQIKNQLAEEGLDFVQKNYDWNQLVQNFEAVYEQLLKN